MAFPKNRENLTTTNLYFPLMPWTYLISLTVNSIRHSTNSNFCPFCIGLQTISESLLRSLSLVSPPLHLPSRKFHPGYCTSVNQASFTNGPSFPLRLYYIRLYSPPSKNTSNNGVVSTVDNSRSLLVEFC